MYLNSTYFRIETFMKKIRIPVFVIFTSNFSTKLKFHL